ncbi:transporter [Streptomyces yunnanensis]|uniref:ABC-2 type transport system permease protein n=1 Tax=Streptomyces yunnanensis TaxID=156453 RepID=A0A9X8QV09_9ACTN|nr:transporter [Streptomyces yunnanensis]SHM32701.1 ABC-2 type transport system permease protein [Streptomyces yunnanensis]
MSTKATAPAALVPVFVRLKLTLLRNGLRQSTGRTAAYVLSAVVGLLFTAAIALGLVALRGNPHAGTLAVTLTGILTLGWAVMPLFFPTGDETLDPTRLVMLPLRPRPLIRALLVTSLVGLGPLTTLVLAAGAVIAVADGPAAAVVGVLAVVLVVLVCVALARAVATASVRLLTSRRGRDLAVLGGLFVAFGAQGVNIAARQLGSPDGLSVLEPLGEVLRWVPPASALGAVDDAGHGAYGRAAAGLALAVAALTLLLWWWQRTLTALMTSPDSSTLQAVEKDSARRSGGAERGLARLLPGGRTGTVMLRTLRYAWRDPKSKMSWAMALGLGLLLPVVYAAQGNGSIYTSFSASALLGLQMYNQFGQDTSAFWMVASTIATPRDAFVELRARALTLMLVAVPYVTLVVVGAAAFIGPWSSFLEVYGLSLGLLGALVATGAMASALFPYSIPSDGNKNVAPGQAGIAWISLFGGFLTAAALTSPLLALTVWLHVAGLSGLLWVLLPAGAVYGLGVATLGLRLAAPRVAARLPEILAAVSKG